MFRIIKNLEKKLAENKIEINSWIQSAYPEFVPPLFCSIDLRNAGFKKAHVDTNLFPGGFNNILKKDIKFAGDKFNDYILQADCDIKKVLIIPEDFTRNVKYFENLKVLKDIIQYAGYEVMFGSSFYQEKMVVNQLSLELNPLTREGNTIRIGSFVPDLILLNNDLFTGVPDVLKGVDQRILPSVKYGWYNRRKSFHFRNYNKIAQKFGEKFNFDSWLISTYFDVAEEINFREKIGIENLAQKVAALLTEISKKYLEYGIKKDPYVFIKPDNGTYGMGIISVKTPEEILNINKKQRHSLNVIKSGVHNSKVIIQEGVYTAESFDGYASERMIYTLGKDIIGNTIRYNTDKDNTSNLNTHGMGFESKGRAINVLDHTICKLAQIAAFKENDT